MSRNYAAPCINSQAIQKRSKTHRTQSAIAEGRRDMTDRIGARVRLHGQCDRFRWGKLKNNRVRPTSTRRHVAADRSYGVVAGNRRRHALVLRLLRNVKKNSENTRAIYSNAAGRLLPPINCSKSLQLNREKRCNFGEGERLRKRSFRVRKSTYVTRIWCLSGFETKRVGCIAAALCFFI